jgi:hypothetical protein
MPGIEGFSLRDDECKSFRLSVDIPVDAKGADELRKAYQQGYLGTADKVITATWIGKLNLSKEAGRGEFAVREVKDVNMVWK